MVCFRQRATISSPVIVASLTWDMDPPAVGESISRVLRFMPGDCRAMTLAVRQGRRMRRLASLRYTGFL
jgi:hypothetical protein